MAKLVSKTYSEALFRLAIEKDELDALTEEVRLILQIWKENPDLKQLLTHPKIPKDQRLSIMKDVFHDRVSIVMEGFLATLMEKDRIMELEAVLSHYEDTVKEYKNIGVATVTTAVDMTEEQKSKLVEKLLETTKYVAFEMNYQVDADIIGGMVIRIGDRVLNNSVKYKLNTMARDLAKVQLS